MKIITAKGTIKSVINRWSMQAQIFGGMLILLVAANACLATNSIVDGDLAVNSSVGQLSHILTGTESVKADFEHKIFTKTGELIQQSNGNMALQNPNKFLWQVTKPERDLVVVDGKNMWHYDEELQQATVQLFDASQQLFPMEMLLAGEAKDLDRIFSVKNLELPRCAKGSEQCFWLKPKKAQDNVQQIILGFSSGTVYYLKLWDQLGQQSEFKFSAVERNPHLAADTFKFTVPKGVDVIGEN